jgi:hypothetical protein
MTQWSRKAVLIRRIAEIVAVLAILFTIAFRFADEGLTISRIWDTITYLVVGISGIIYFVLVELTRDPRLRRRGEADFVHSMISFLFGGSLLLGIIWIISVFAVRVLSIHLFDTTILFDATFLCLDVTGLCIVVSLFLVQRRLNRSAQSQPNN